MRTTVTTLKTVPALVVFTILVGVSAASASPITLMSATTNDGSFESNVTPTGWLFNPSPVVLPPVWTITSASSTNPNGGLLSNPPHSGTLAGADGVDALFADGDPTSPNSTTATSFDLLGGTYTAVSAGDMFTWSFMLNSFASNASGSLQLKFGGITETVGTGLASNTTLADFVVISGTYVATAADAGAGPLSVIFTIRTGGPGVGNVYGDNVRLSVDPVPEPASLLLLGSGLILVAGATRRWRRRAA